MLTKIRQSKIKIYNFNVGFSNYCIKIPGEHPPPTKKNINDTIKAK